MMEDFKNDYMDGKVNSGNYPESSKYMSAILDTFSDLERSVELDKDPIKALRDLLKASEFVHDFSEAEKVKNFTLMSEILEKFSGVSVDMEAAQLEMKEYLKDKIDKM